MSYTPGPWKPHFEEAYFVTGPDLGRVAIMMNLKGAHGLGGRRSGNEVAANARLIAAAPELVEALQEALRYVSPPLNEYDMSVEAMTHGKCRALLARIKGEA